MALQCDPVALLVSLPLSVRKTLSVKQGSRAGEADPLGCRCSGGLTALSHNTVASKEAVGSDANIIRAGPHPSVDKTWTAA